jgi:hypothetical protein
MRQTNRKFSLSQFPIMIKKIENESDDDRRRKNHLGGNLQLAPSMLIVHKGIFNELLSRNSTKTSVSNYSKCFLVK